MRPYKIQKIDLSNDYPCPCRRRGRVHPIVLTEAFGCDRCQQIFVLKENSQVIEQLSSIYHKKAWRWTGGRWTNVSANWTKNFLSTMWAIVLMLPIITIVAFPFALRLSSSQNIVLWAMILLLLIVLPAFMVWLAYRH
ncbi:MAG: hypothetical protein ACRC11_17125 [Xenococcaceae cyanobacterium]